MVVLELAEEFIHEMDLILVLIKFDSQANESFARF